MRSIHRLLISIKKYFGAVSEMVIEIKQSFSLIFEKAHWIETTYFQFEAGMIC